MDRDEELLFTAEVLALARVSRGTLDKWVTDGLLPMSQLEPRGIRRFRRSDVLALISPPKQNREEAANDLLPGDGGSV